MQLTDSKIRHLKYHTDGSKRQKYSDGGQLYLEVKPNGKKFWYMDYKTPYTKKRKTLAFGEYPLVSLADARKKRDTAKHLLTKNLDPSIEQKKRYLQQQEILNCTFAKYTKEYLENVQRNLSHSTYISRKAVLNRYILPYIAHIPITHISTKLLKEELFKRPAVAKSKSIEKKIKTITKAIFELAIDDEIIEHNPAIKLKPRPFIAQHFPAVTDPAQLAKILQLIFNYQQTGSNALALLKLCAYLWQRPSEIRTLTWDKVDFVNKRLVYQVSKTKQEHIVPLSTQAMNIFLQLKNQQQTSYVFPGKQNQYCLNAMAAHRILCDLGLKNIQTVHGFRATARTMIEEVLKYPRPHIIEFQLAHRIKDPNGRAYNRTKFIDERYELMQRWADYIDALRLGHNTDRFVYRFIELPLYSLQSFSSL